MTSRNHQKFFFGTIFVLMLVMPSAAQESGPASMPGNTNGNSSSYNPAYGDEVNVSVGAAISDSTATNSGAAFGQAQRKDTGSTGASSWGPVLPSAQKSPASAWSEKILKNSGSEAQGSSIVSRPGETKGASSSLRNSSEKFTGVRRNSQQASASEPDTQFEKTLGSQISKQRHSTPTSNSSQSTRNSSIASLKHGTSGSAGSTGHLLRGKGTAKTEKKKGWLFGSKDSGNSIAGRSQ